MSRVVVKIGSNILAGKTEGLDHERIRMIAHDVSELAKGGHEVAVVSSGAIAAGMEKIGLREKPREIRLKQAAAAVGQSSLMWAYERSFSPFGRKVAQVLLTRGVFSNRATYLNARNTLITLLAHGIIPIINENDVVATDEIKFGDNDQLAALVSGLINADRLVILSDVEGLFTGDPKQDPEATIIRRVTEVTADLENRAGAAGSVYGTGGMYSKILAARKALSYGIMVNIISGRKEGLLVLLMAGEAHGTEFVPQTRRISSRKGWIAYAVRPSGTITVDTGAVEAVKSAGRSLLPSGVTKVEGTFDVGDVVHLADTGGTKFAKGIVNYSSQDVDRIKGRRSSEVEAVLGYKYSDEVIHRDNLVILKKGLAV